MYTKDSEDDGILFVIALLHPKSSGEIKLSSTDPFDYPLIDPRYLEHPEDVKTLRKGCITTLYLMSLMSNTSTF